MWLTDQNNALFIFLTYGRELTPEEQERLQFDVDEDGNTLLIPSPPKLSDFKYKVRQHINNHYDQMMFLISDKILYLD